MNELLSLEFFVKLQKSVLCFVSIFSDMDNFGIFNKFLGFCLEM